MELLPALLVLLAATVLLLLLLPYYALMECGLQLELFIALLALMDIFVNLVKLPQHLLVKLVQLDLYVIPTI